MKIRDISQTNEAKLEYDNKSVIRYLLNTNFKTKEEMANQLHCSTRTVRNLISELRMYYPVISYSSNKGYALPPIMDEIKDFAELNKARDMVQHTLNEIKSRVDVLNKEMKPLIAYLKELEKKEAREYANIGSVEGSAGAL